MRRRRRKMRKRRKRKSSSLRPSGLMWFKQVSGGPGGRIGLPDEDVA